MGEISQNILLLALVKDYWDIYINGAKFIKMITNNVWPLNLIKETN